MRALPSFCLSNDTAVVTALCNDIGVEVVFARQVAAFGAAGRHRGGAVHQRQLGEPAAGPDGGRAAGMLTVGIAGYEGGQMAELDGLDYLFVAPSSSVHRIQEAQTTVYHALWELTLAALARAGDAMPRRTLVACLGNIFLSDDGFGVEVAAGWPARSCRTGRR